MEGRHRISTVGINKPEDALEVEAMGRGGGMGILLMGMQLFQMVKKLAISP